MSLPQVGKPFMPDAAENYQGLDRGLFYARRLTFTDGFGDLVDDDVYCRISRIEVYNFQGVSKYCIIGYQVLAFRKQPVNEVDYKDNFQYVNPVAPKITTYYFQATPEGMNVRMLEQLCISNFIGQVRSKDPNQLDTLVDLYAAFSPYKDALMVSAGGQLGVDNVSHLTLFRSTDGKPAALVSQQLRYRGYELDASQNRLSQWKYSEGQYLYSDQAFIDRTRMVMAAKEDFANRIDEAKQLLGIS